MPRVPPVTSAVRFDGAGESAVVTRSRAKKREVGPAFGDALHVERGLADVVIAPLARFAARGRGPLGHVVPPVRPVIDGVEQQPLVRRLVTEPRTAAVE